MSTEARQWFVTDDGVVHEVRSITRWVAHEELRSWCGLMMYIGVPSIQMSWPARAINCLECIGKPR